MAIVSEASLRRFYSKKGFSVAQIAKRFKCSQHRVDYWLKRYNIQKRSISDALYRRHNPNGDPFEIRSIHSQETALLLGLGLGLYWGEGNKRNPSAIRLGNTDPLLIRKFIQFLRDILGVSITKLRFGLQVFSDMSPTKAKRIWLGHLRGLGIVPEQFQRPIVTPARSAGTYHEKTQWGVLTVYCSNIKLKRILDEMLAKHAV
jgi:Homeodomain-like domain-containing protein